MEQNVWNWFPESPYPPKWSYINGSLTNDGHRNELFAWLWSKLVVLKPRCYDATSVPLKDRRREQCIALEGAGTSSHSPEASWDCGELHASLCSTLHTVGRISALVIVSTSKFPSPGLSCLFWPTQIYASQRACADPNRFSGDKAAAGK